MMSKRKWFVLLVIFIVYLLLGTGIFYNIESAEENRRLEEEKQERLHIYMLMNEVFNHSASRSQGKLLFSKLTDYCGKPFLKNEDDIQNDIHHWDFYHTLFFVITVVSTIGYGNLAPTTSFTRIFMIFYAIIGIPMNGILMVTLGDFFGRTFTKLYGRWKSSKMKSDTTRLGLISQIILYLVPGFTFFIFFPAGIMVLFEGWPYDLAVYYCFVTLTTIGFGDFVAGVDYPTQKFTTLSHWVYKIFLLIWVIIGLGYVVMILGYITQAMRSKKIRALEQAITQNIKKTPVKIRQELRGLLQELLFLKVKRVYKKDFDYIPKALERTQSCPDLTIYSKSSPSTTRKRALSMCPYSENRFQSDTELNMIDKERTFGDNQKTELLQIVVNALAENVEDFHPEGYQGFSDSQILASERFGSQWSLKSQHFPAKPRRRAVSDIRVPSTNFDSYNSTTWYGQQAKEQFNEFIRYPRTNSEPSEMERPQQNFLTKLKNKFIPPREEKSDKILLDVEKQSGARRRASMFTTMEQDSYLKRTSRGRPSVLSIPEQEAVLEETSIADFLRALSAVAAPDTLLGATPKRKLGTAGLSPPKLQSPPKVRRQAIRPNVSSRRTSLLMPEVPSVPMGRRRFSLRPVEENLLVPPPPYSSVAESEPSKPLVQNRKFSRINNIPTISISPVQRQVQKRESKDEGGS